MAKADVAFTVDDVRGIYKKAVERGATSVREPWEEQVCIHETVVGRMMYLILRLVKDEHGVVVMATIKTYGDVEHTFVERKNYKGAFLPGYVSVRDDPILSFLWAYNVL